jgi:Zn finger protein HypA/HybF involved in hydrogenase expression
MHEAAIVASVVRTAMRATPAGTVLRRVCVRVGVLTGVSPDAMRFYFDAVQPGRAELEVAIEPLRATCLGCGKYWVLREATWSCPDCRIGVLNFENGDELDLVAIEVQDAGDDSNRREDPGEKRRIGSTEPEPV